MLNMIKFDKVNFAYKQKKILVNFSFVFNDQTIYSLFAPSGAGKTTLLNLIARINTPQSGTIENSAKRISYCFQEILLVNELTIFANLELVLFSVYKNKAKRKQIIMKWLKIIKMSKYAYAYPHQLSTGMKKLIDLVRAFIFPSKVILLDEPFVGLDLITKKKMISYFIALWNKTKPIVILNSHDPFILYSLSHTIIKCTSAPLKPQYLFKINQPLNKRTYDKEFHRCEKFLLR